MLELKELTEINAVSGNEGKIRGKLVNMITPYADSVTVDTMGNIIAHKKGTQKSDKTIIVSAHMDEVGFIISDITDDGYLKFKSVGGIDPGILLAQRVVVGDNEIKGVIGVKAVHLQSPSERKTVIKEKDMYIDIGASSGDEARSMVSKGDYAAFDSRYILLGRDMVKAKALDDRVGCAILTELIKESYPSDIYFCFCVQEEVGLRGARVLAKRLDADIALILESTTCSDVPDTKGHQLVTKLGDGPAVSVMDGGSYSDKELNELIFDTAKQNRIRYQLKKSAMGGNDAGAYQTGGTGCRTAVISLPCRYIHSPVSCAKLGDMDNMLKLAKAVLERL